MFMVEGKLVSVEMEDSGSSNEKTDDPIEEIKNRPELKKSLQHYMDNPEMKRYTVDEIKRKRHGR
ncbi:hypothetical protein CR205_11620 [Alteribacter lacisalsi]|uniref:Uncharacterized protein n=1 Tax=Alteribacter lacisalsi TaxID=2045244 RepID=A0A2W0HS31_9BACI|nr:hypothetical protein CR205_11620 [Alteribacter lacisalsi]